MAYVLGPDHNHKNPALKRLDHVICRVPDIVRYHAHWTQVLGFPEAWPIGRFWPEGKTSGIALGGINLELIQPDYGAPAVPVCDTLVFEPTNFVRAREALNKVGLQGETFEKWEDDPELLRLRGFKETEVDHRQLICRNVFPKGELPVPFFLCEYSAGLRERLTEVSRPTPAGRVIALEMQLEKSGSIWRLADLGYLGEIELLQIEDRFGPFQVTGMKFENGVPEQGDLPLGFHFI